MKFIADLHIHSRYSRATSKDMDINTLSKWARIKGLKLLGTGDFTHPLWLNELESFLKEAEDGIYEHNGVYFLLSTEVSNIFPRSKGIKKIHNIIFSPNFTTVEKINSAFKKYGDLYADGRPTLSLDTITMVKLLMDISEDIMIIPSHAWTPHFSLFGANSGFDSIDECFGSQSVYIYSIETGLSSDPPMNWRLSNLDAITLISNSDAHSPQKIAREANVFDCQLSYKVITEAIKNKDKDKLLYTIEFYPEEGKYHYDGHRNCKVRFTPKETKNVGYLCPVCNKKLTVGVLHRVDELADRSEGTILDTIGYKNLIPLQEIIADVMGSIITSNKVTNEYFKLVTEFGSEFNVLLDVSFEDLLKVTSYEIAEGIIKSRNGEVEIQPGYDGVYGKISIKKEKSSKVELHELQEKQLELL